MVVVDDASVDDTVAVAESSSRGLDVRVLVNEVNRERSYFTEPGCR